MSTVTDLATYQQFAMEQQAQNNAWSAQQAQKQMDFQKEMSNTAHQREVADLKAAGLNPILSVNSGASVPNGASAEADTSTAGNVGAILQQVLQAQSAREVAGMYNAATIAAATIAANASMYGSDMGYLNSEDHPNTLEAVAARDIMKAQQAAGENGTTASKVRAMVESVVGDRQMQRLKNSSPVKSYISNVNQLISKYNLKSSFVNQFISRYGRDKFIQMMNTSRGRIYIKSDQLAWTFGGKSQRNFWADLDRRYR